MIDTMFKENSLEIVIGAFSFDFLSSLSCVMYEGLQEKSQREGMQTL